MIEPETSNFSAGFVSPTPTLPSDKMRSLSSPLTYVTNGVEAPEALIWNSALAAPNWPVRVPL